MKVLYCFIRAEEEKTTTKMVSALLELTFNASMSTQTAAVVREGQLAKLKNHGVGSTWKKQHFTLK
jgi:hypothetical protein